MSEHLHHFKEMIPVGLINGATLAAVTLADAESLLKVVLLGVTIVYTCVKIFHAVKRKKSDEN